MLSFINTFSEYHQIPMFQPDEEKTTFMMPHGIYYNRAMSFGLKNVGATYQRLMKKNLQTPDQPDRGSLYGQYCVKK